MPNISQECDCFIAKNNGVIIHLQSHFYLAPQIEILSPWFSGNNVENQQFFFQKFESFYIKKSFKLIDEIMTFLWINIRDLSYIFMDCNTFGIFFLI